MEALKIQARDFKTRAALESYIIDQFGDDIRVNRSAGYTIEGSAEELKALGLDTASRVFGVRCVLIN